MDSKPIRIGVISDTHGLVRPSAVAFLQGCDSIIHAGDICSQEVLDQLATIAPVTAVRGNNDVGAWAQSLCETELIKVGDVFIYVVHDLADLGIDPPGAGVRVVISGHSHKPKIEEKNGVLFLNPGSAGPRRYMLPISIAEITVAHTSVTAHLHELE